MMNSIALAVENPTLRIQKKTNVRQPETNRSRYKQLSFAFCRILLISILFFTLQVSRLNAQTDFAPGEIMFTGFNSDNPDAFSIVFLKDAVANTIIYITDRGWDNSLGDGFRVDNDGEGTISFTFPAAYSCGAEFVFSYNAGGNSWEVRNAAGVLIGTCTIQAGGDVNGPELGCVGGGCPDGDQLFIYQSPEPTPTSQSSFVTAINLNNAGNDTGWNTDNNSDPNSERPQALSFFDVVTFPFQISVIPFNAETDNAKYDCDPRAGSGTYIKNQITNSTQIPFIRRISTTSCCYLSNSYNL